MLNFKQKEVSCIDGTYKIAYIDSIPDHPTWYSHEDEKTVREKFWRISKNDLVFDIGAAYGSYTMSALKQGAKFVYSWAPEAGAGVNDANEKFFLEQSLLLNNWETKCTVFDFGFWSENGYIDTFDKCFFKSKPDVVKNPFYFFQVFTFDEWYDSYFSANDDIQKYNNVWMKIDVEGAEIKVLNGSLNFIRTFKPKIMIENHDFMEMTIYETRKILGEIGYKEVLNEPYHSVSHSLFLID